MSLKLAKDNTDPYDYYANDGSDPITVAGTLTGAGGTLTLATENPVYLIAEDDTGAISGYTGITIAPINEEDGIDWEISTDNSTWSESISPADMDVSSADQALLIYIRAVVTNDGTANQPATASYSLADFQIDATETPV